MRIIPAIDLIDGKCVRLTKGDYDTKKVYNEDPVAVAQTFEKQGCRYLHLVDLDGAKAGRVVNHEVLEAISNATDLKIDFGGGLRTTADVELAFACGAKQITAGSVAVKDPDLVAEWLDTYGPERVILGADVRERTIAIHGWQASGGVDVFDFLEKYVQRGIRYVVCTEISKDGMLAGAAHDLYRDILQAFPRLRLIASGGVSRIEDIEQLATLGCDGAIIGKAIYEGHIDLAHLIG